MIETRIIAALKAAPSMPMVFYGFVPQPERGDQPAPKPVVVVNRITSSWANTFCGLDPNYSEVGIQVDIYADSNEICRVVANLARDAIRVMPGSPTLNGESTGYDDASRAFRVLQSWTAVDYQPGTI